VLVFFQGLLLDKKAAFECVSEREHHNISASHTPLAAAAAAAAASAAAA